MGDNGTHAALIIDCSLELCYIGAQGVEIQVYRHWQQPVSLDYGDHVRDVDGWRNV